MPDNEEHPPEYSKEYYNYDTEQWEWDEWKLLTNDLDFSKYPYAIRFRYVLGRN